MGIFLDVIYWFCGVFSALVLIVAFIGAILAMLWDIKLGDDDGTPRRQR